jgi:hypothetical protein
VSNKNCVGAGGKIENARRVFREFNYTNFAASINHATAF